MDFPDCYDWELRVEGLYTGWRKLSIPRPRAFDTPSASALSGIQRFLSKEDIGEVYTVWIRVPKWRSFNQLYGSPGQAWGPFTIEIKSVIKAVPCLI